jgi:hypothetical protein
VENFLSYDDFINEAKESRDLKNSDAKDFITTVLKLGSKQNIFDTYINKNGIKPDQLSDLIKQVIDELNKNWQ